VKSKLYFIKETIIIANNLFFTAFTFQLTCIFIVLITIISYTVCNDMYFRLKLISDRNVSTPLRLRKSWKI